MDDGAHQEQNTQVHTLIDIDSKNRTAINNKSTGKDFMRADLRPISRTSGFTCTLKHTLR